MKKQSEKDRVRKLLQDKASVRLDIGCGENKKPGSIGVDFREMEGVDIVQDLTMFPWKNIPDECADVVMASHVLEHINPASSDPRTAALIKLLTKKKVLTANEVKEYIGDYEFLGGFVRFMDEIWRILKKDGQLIFSVPFAGSPGFWQDPTHVNPMTHVTLAYFDPLAKDKAGNQYHLYTIYRPKPYKLQTCFYDTNGFMEIAMNKRQIDPSYKTLEDTLVDKKLKKD